MVNHSDADAQISAVLEVAETEAAPPDRASHEGRGTCGCDYDMKGYSTRDEARRMARLLGLQPGCRLLDVGAGAPTWTSDERSKLLVPLPPSVATASAFGSSAAVTGETTSSKKDMAFLLYCAAARPDVGPRGSGYDIVVGARAAVARQAGCRRHSRRR